MKRASVLMDGQSPVTTGKVVHKGDEGNMGTVREDIDKRDDKRAKLEAAAKAIKDQLREMDKEENEEALAAVTESVCKHIEKLTNRIVLNDETNHKRVTELIAKILGFGARNRVKGESDGYSALGRSIAKAVESA